MIKNINKNNAFGYYATENPTAVLRTSPRRVSDTPSALCLNLATDFQWLATPLFLKRVLINY